MGIMDVIKGERIYLDTNIIIYPLEGYPECASSLATLFAAIDEGKLSAVTSELTLAESLVKPMIASAQSPITPCQWLNWNARWEH
ncbi:MAG: hypothetical protein V1897_06415 [Pseudomonadota bacterium]